LPVSFSGFARGNKQYASEACSRQEEFINEFFNQNSYEKIASSTIVGAWQQCIGNSGAHLTPIATDHANLFKFEISYKAPKGIGPLPVNEITLYQIDKDGKVKPVQCPLIAGIGDIDLKEQKANSKVPPFTLEDDQTASFLCAKEVCSSAFVSVDAKMDITPKNGELTIEAPPNYKSGCVPPPLPPECTKESTSAIGKCARCDFDISHSGPPSDQWGEKICSNMPPGEPVQIEFKGSAFTSKGYPSPASCHIYYQFRSPDGKPAKLVASDNVDGCRTSAGFESGFFAPSTPGLGSGAFRITMCSAPPGANQSCDMAGHMSIYVPEGQSK
jgi:hypothetical protein